MKRRQFIQKSTLTAAALAIPWSKMLAQTPAECSAEFEKTKDKNDAGEYLSIQMYLCKETITGFEKAEAINKIIKIRIQKSKPPETKDYRAELKIKSVKPYQNALSDYKVETEFLQENVKEFDLPKELNIKKLSFLYHPGNIDVLDKKGNTYLTIVEKTGQKSSGSGCFLTTACVNILGKTDDCAELTVLRKFRDEVLESSENGKKLIHDYYHIAPGIVEAIDIRDDKQIVYTDIYNHMILPTIYCIKKNDKQGAISIYKNYTLKLKEKFL